MAGRFQDGTVTSLVMGIASLVMGVVLCMNPSGVALLATRLVGVILVVAGAATLVGYLRAGAQRSPVTLFVCIIEFAFGAILIAWPAIFVQWLVIILGAFILVMGVSDFVGAQAAARLGAPFATGKMIMAVLTVAIGVVVIVSPFVLVDVAFIVAGVGLILNGVTEIVAAIKD